MKASGTSFFSIKPIKMFLSPESKRGTFLPDDVPVDLKVCALPLNLCKMRYFATPNLPLNKLKPLIESRLKIDPIIDLEQMGYAIKKVEGGVEVHFYKKNSLDEAADFDAVVSGHQAFFCYLKDYCKLTNDALVIFYSDDAFYCFDYTPKRFVRYFSCESIDALISTMTLTYKDLIDKKILTINLAQELLGSNTTVIEEKKCPLAIGAALEFLSSNEPFFLRSFLESSSMGKKFFLKMQRMAFLSGMICLSLFVLFSTIKNNFSVQNQKNLSSLKELENYVVPFSKEPVAVGKIFDELLVSIEPFGLDVVELSYSANIFEKKPVCKFEFILQGSDADIEKYAQSIQKCPSSHLSKIQRSDPTNKRKFSVEIKI